MTELVEAVAEQGLLAADRPVVVLYSGGVDSTCLLDVAARIAGPEQVSAVHVNYGLREAAEDDERHCRQLSAELGIALEVHRARRGGAAGNVQAWAREVRYAAADSVARGRGADGGDADVAAGHTASDQVETILYRLASSPSRRALLGMRAREGRLVRPLLSFPRARTQAYCEDRGLAWREDDSNASPAYARGRVRHELVPALERVHPAAQANVLALASTLADEAAVLDQLVDGVLAGGQTVTLAGLRALPLALARLVVQRLADAAAGRPAAGVARRAEDILALPAAGTAMLDLPAGVRATVRAGVLSFAPTPALRPMAQPPASPRRSNTIPK